MKLISISFLLIVFSFTSITQVSAEERIKFDKLFNCSQVAIKQAKKLFNEYLISRNKSINIVEDTFQLFYFLTKFPKNHDSNASSKPTEDFYRIDIKLSGADAPGTQNRTHYIASTNILLSSTDADLGKCKIVGSQKFTKSWNWLDNSIVNEKSIE